MTKKTTKNKLPTQPTRLSKMVEPVVESTSPVLELEQTTVEPVVEEVVIPPVVQKSPQYKIVSEKNGNTNMQREIEQLLEEGWVLQGGVATSMYSSPYETVTLFSQSLTKNI